MGEFQDLGLNPSLVKALHKCKFVKPTKVQQQNVTAALQGRDLVTKAKTGSGKTLAYVIPILNKLIEPSSLKVPGVKALILVPTRELCEQVHEQIRDLLKYIDVNIQVQSLSTTQTTLHPNLMPAIIIATPKRFNAATSTLAATSAHAAQQLTQQLTTFVLDEADLQLSYGYKDDLHSISTKVPRSCQCMLLSATATADVDTLSQLALHNPLVLDVRGDGAEDGADAEGDKKEQQDKNTISHYYYQCERDDKLLVVIALLKLKLVRAKVLIFVNAVDMAYRIRLVCSKFGIRSVILHNEQPLNSRHHVIKQFNAGVYDHMIAVDMSASTQRSQSRQKRKAGSARVGGGDDDDARDPEFGVTRGVDFKGVKTVINFECPDRSEVYIHRVGRTGRAGHKGTAITLLPTQLDTQVRSVMQRINTSLETAASSSSSDAPQAQGPPGTDIAQPTLDGKNKSVTLADAPDEAAEPTGVPETLASAPLRAALTQMRTYKKLTPVVLDALRYRVADVARGITKHVIREAAAREIRDALLRSDKLSEYFETHPQEHDVLKCDKPLVALEDGRQLSHVPGYLWVAADVGKGAKRKGASKKRAKVGGGGGSAAAADPMRAKAPARFTFNVPAKTAGVDVADMTQLERDVWEAAQKSQRKKQAKEQYTGGVGVIGPKKNVRKGKRKGK